MKKKCENKMKKRQYVSASLYVRKGSNSLKKIMLKYNFMKTVITDSK